MELKLKLDLDTGLWRGHVTNDAAEYEAGASPRNGAVGEGVMLEAAHGAGAGFASCTGAES